MRVVGLTGLSGVGKVYFASNLVREVAVDHVTASSLILQEKKVYEKKPEQRERLRLGNLDENQELLVAAIRRLASTSSASLLLDCHVVIDGANGLKKLQAPVFEKCGVEMFIFLYDDAEAIRLRRQTDTTRIRPNLSSEQIEIHQQIALRHCADLCVELAIPFVLIKPSMTGIAGGFIGTDSFTADLHP